MDPRRIGQPRFIASCRNEGHCEAMTVNKPPNRLSMPAEWEPQDAIWLSWPHNIETWPSNLREAQGEFADLARTIASTQPVKILCGDELLPDAQNRIGEVRDLEWVAIATNDAWARDYAPTFVQDLAANSLVAIDWHYNAWGGKYPPYEKDQQVAQRVARHLGIESVSPDLCFEGGGLEINQNGLVISTQTCALDPHRNPGKSLTDVEQLFQKFLGATHTVWLTGDAIEGDDTDGHIDQLARFTDNETVVYAWSDDPFDRQQPLLARNLRELKVGLSEAGSEFRLVPLPIPQPIRLSDRRIPASYCNFLICNHLVVVPQFQQKAADEKAIKILTSLFPKRDVVGLSSLHLSVGLGSFHCLSQQQPSLAGT
jgi:agmatine deiminase